jgi:hypothetical protein
VVDVAVGQPDLFDGHAGLGHGIDDGGHVPAGIEYHGAPGGLAPQQQAILLKQGDGDDGCAGFGLVAGLVLGSVCHTPHIAYFCGPAKGRKGGAAESQAV